MNVIRLIVILPFFYISRAEESRNENGNSASILVIGLSGSGVFSTVEKLVRSPIEKGDNSIPSVTEYSWQVNNNENLPSTFKIAYVPGLISGKGTTNDTKTIAAVHEYIENPNGLNNQAPSVVIVVSRFDGDEDTLLRMLKSVEGLQLRLSSGNGPSNIIFHFTHLMSKGLNEAKQPNKTIDKYTGIIRRFTNFPQPIRATVGENRPDDYRLIYVGGYTRLPNKQLYPKNLMDSIEHVLTARGDNVAKEIVKEAFNPHEIPFPQVKTFSANAEAPEPDSMEYESVTENIRSNNPSKGSEINEALERAYSNLDEELKSSHPNILPLVKMAFQQLNITSRDKLPKTTLKTVQLFQKLPFHLASLALVHEAFGIRQPEFIYPPIVGQGYDILNDETVPRSPFVINNFQPTPIGYALPDILTCKIENEKSVEIFKLVQSYDHYKESRLQDLSINVVEEPVNSSVFVGTVRSSYNNLRPDADAFVALTAVQEIRNFRLDLLESSDLDQEFLSDVNNLAPFTPNDRESSKEWKSFFNKYGTHVVSEGFGGGYMEGKASGEAIRNNLRYTNVLYGIKDNLISFASLPHGVNSGNTAISHAFFGGSPDVILADVHKLPSKVRESILRKWKDSVRSDPKILEINLKLKPISSIATLVNPNIGHEVKNALDHHLKGTLVYNRQKPPKSTPSRFLPTTENPFIYRPRSTTLSSTTVSSTTECSCPQSSCSQCPPYIMCEIPQCPSTNPEKVAERTCPEIKPKDTSQNVLGQGFHMLKDSILPKSPFILETERKMGILVPRGVTIKQMENPCLYVRFERIPTYLEYLSKRMNSTYPPSIPPTISPGETTSPGHIRPGYNIMENLTSSGPFSVYQEHRYFHLQSDFRRFALSSEFKKDLASLPYYNTRNCTVNDQWLKFFNTYGTHIVTEGYAGILQNLEFIGMKDEDLFSLLETENEDGSSGQCNTARQAPKKLPENGVVAIETVKLKSLKDILQIMNYPSHALTNKYDAFMMALLKNRIKGC